MTDTLQAYTDKIRDWLPGFMFPDTFENVIIREKYAAGMHPRGVAELLLDNKIALLNDYLPDGKKWHR